VAGGPAQRSGRGNGARRSKAVLGSTFALNRWVGRSSGVGVKWTRCHRRQARWPAKWREPPGRCRRLGTVTRSLAITTWSQARRELDAYPLRGATPYRSDAGMGPDLVSVATSRSSGPRVHVAPRLLGRPANARLEKTTVGPTSFVRTEGLGCRLAPLGSDAEVALSSASGGRGGSGSLRTWWPL
jgi:hypothetical protein